MAADTSGSAPDPFAVAHLAAQRLAEITGRPGHDVVVVLGTGWQRAAASLTGAGLPVPVGDLPGFAAPTVPGHGDAVRSVDVRGLGVLVFTGRVHLYEGHTPATVVHPVRTAAAAGCRVAVLTNAAGSLRTEWPGGQVVAVADHLNLTGVSPTAGLAVDGPNPFVDLSEAYAPRLRALAQRVDPHLPEGVYAAVAGPNFETPAEVRALGRLGADLVGMSTVLEVIAARQLGVEVLGLSLVTNPAAGLGAHLDVAEIVSAGFGVADRLGALLVGVLEELAADRAG